MSILVLAEHDGTGALKRSTLHALQAAIEIDTTDIHVCVIAEDPAAVAQACQTVEGVAKVIICAHADFAHPLAEAAAPVLAELSKGYSHVLAPATSLGKNIIPRAAALSDMQAISDITKVHNSDTFDRPVYAGNAVATVRSSDAVKFITVRTTAFDAVATEGGSAVIEAATLDGYESNTLSGFVSHELSVSDRPELADAGVVVSGGRGVGSAEDFALIDALADKLNGAVGASRAAVDSGYAPNDYQVGQTGKVVAPDLYIAVGISGAIQHLAGMKDSKVIVAINKDEDAPIFQVADYGLVADLFDALPELTNKL